MPAKEEGEITAAIFAAYGIAPDGSAVIVRGLKRRPEKWRDFMMKFELGLDEPDPQRALKSALTIGGAYIAGGLLPLLPYMI